MTDASLSDLPGVSSVDRPLTALEQSEPPQLTSQPDLTSFVDTVTVTLPAPPGAESTFPEPDTNWTWNSSPSYLVGSMGSRPVHHYRLYHPPERPDAAGLAGYLITVNTTYTDEPAIVAFLRISSDSEESSIPHRVVELTVEPRVQRLDQQNTLTDIREALTDTTWTVPHPNPSYREWRDAITTLRAFFEEHADRLNYHIPSQLFGPPTSHAIARYPGDTDKLLSQVAMHIDRADCGPSIHSFARTSPFCVEQLLCDYAATVIQLETPSCRFSSTRSPRP